MTRRGRLPGADELFRATDAPAEQDPAPAEPAPLSAAGRLLADTPPADVPPESRPSLEATDQDGAAPASARRRARPASHRRPTGRERHDEKITVYVSAEELLDLEHARLTLRGEHGLAVDRGRIVREALAFVLADLDTKGNAAILVERLRGS